MSLKNWVHNWDKTDSYFFGAIVGLLIGLAYYFFGTDYTDFIITCVVIILSWWSYADQKAKIREWAKKTFTPENIEDKFGITVTKYECENLLKEFEELK